MTSLTYTRRSGTATRLQNERLRNPFSIPGRSRDLSTGSGLVRGPRQPLFKWVHGLLTGGWSFFTTHHYTVPSLRMCWDIHFLSSYFLKLWCLLKKGTNCYRNSRKETKSTLCVCVCVCVYTHTHTHNQVGCHIAKLLPMSYNVRNTAACSTFATT